MELTPLIFKKLSLERKEKMHIEDSQRNKPIRQEGKTLVKQMQQKKTCLGT